MTYATREDRQRPDAGSDPERREKSRYCRRRVATALSITVSKLAPAIAAPTAKPAVGSRTGPLGIELDRENPLMGWSHDERQVLAHRAHVLSARRDVTESQLTS